MLFAVLFNMENESTSIDFCKYQSSNMFYIISFWYFFRTDVDITDEERNKTLVKNDIKDIQEDSHDYYNSTVIQNENFTNLHRQSIYADCANLTINKLLSKSHRRAMTVKLPFEFQFYGHPINNIT